MSQILTQSQIQQVTLQEKIRKMQTNVQLNETRTYVGLCSEYLEFIPFKQQLDFVEFTLIMIASPSQSQKLIQDSSLDSLNFFHYKQSSGSIQLIQFLTKSFWKTVKIQAFNAQQVFTLSEQNNTLAQLASFLSENRGLVMGTKAQEFLDLLGIGMEWNLNQSDSLLKESIFYGTQRNPLAFLDKSQTKEIGQLLIEKKENAPATLQLTSDSMTLNEIAGSSSRFLIFEILCMKGILPQRKEEIPQCFVEFAAKMTYTQNFTLNLSKRFSTSINLYENNTEQACKFLGRINPFEMMTQDQKTQIMGKKLKVKVKSIGIKSDLQITKIPSDPSQTVNGNITINVFVPISNQVTTTNLNLMRGSTNPSVFSEWFASKQYAKYNSAELERLGFDTQWYEQNSQLLKNASYVLQSQNPFQTPLLQESWDDTNDQFNRVYFFHSQGSQINDLESLSIDSIQNQIIEYTQEFQDGFFPLWINHEINTSSSTFGILDSNIIFDDLIDMILEFEQI